MIHRTSVFNAKRHILHTFDDIHVKHKLELLLFGRYLLGIGIIHHTLSIITDIAAHSHTLYKQINDSAHNTHSCTLSPR